MVIEVTEELFFARHHGLEKAQHEGPPLFWWALLAIEPPAPSTGQKIPYISK
jgi:hypothetical protein